MHILSEKYIVLSKILIQTPKINTSNLFFISHSGNEVTNAIDNAPRIPPITIIFLQTFEFFLL